MAGFKIGDKVEITGWLDEYIGKKGEILNTELSTIIHEYDRNISKHLWVKYSGNNCNDRVVAKAIQSRILKKEDIPQELLEELAGMIESCERGSL